MGRSNKGKVLEKIAVLDMAAEGKCVARVNDKVIFISHVAPGDVVDVRITKDKSKFSEAVPVHFHSYSELREKPVCQHYGVCGGCKWQHIQYPTQLKYKQQQVKDNFERLGHLPTDTMLPIVGSDEIFAYRNKLEFTATNWRWLEADEIASGQEFDRRGLGFHIPGAFDKVMDIESCHLQHDLSNQIRNAIRDKAKEIEMPFYYLRSHEGVLRNVMIRNTTSGEWMVIIQFKTDEPENIILLNYLKDKFPQITSLLYVVNAKQNDTIFDQDVKTFYGKDHIVEVMPKDENSVELLKFKIGPKSFYQTNSRQAYKLYEITRNLAEIQDNEVVYDLYTGTGTIANFVAHKARKVIGVEYVEMAIEDAIINSKLNQINNTSFFAGDMKDVLTTDFIERHGHPDTMIIDPPRAGMHENVINTILKVLPKKIVYVSCNPATQARDLDLMSE